MSPALLERLGLQRPEMRAWALYDWANSALATVIVTAIFPVYYTQVACAGLPPATATQRHALGTTLALVLVALMAPFLGALADARPLKKRLLTTFLMLGAAACAAMFLVQQGDWLLATCLFALANVGASGSFVFYDSLLPHVARSDEVDRLSTAGYALGYLGGGLLLALCLLWIRFPHWFGLPGADASPEAATLPARLAFVSVGVWWLLFSIPLLRRVPEPAILTEPQRTGSTREVLRQLHGTFQALRRSPQALRFLLAFLVFNDGILTIIRMSTIYGTEIGLPRQQLLLAVLLVQFIGVPFAFLFGSLAGRIGPKACINLALAVFTGIAFLGYVMSTPAHFFLLAILVAMVMGGTQALSRSLFASMIPRDRTSELFAFFAVVEKFAGILGPAVFALLISWTGSSRAAVLSVGLFFIAGAILLARVDVASGRRQAAEASWRPNPS